MRLFILKIALIFIFTFSINFSQKEVRILGGYNFSTLKYNLNQINDRIDISTRKGLNIGFEYHYPRLIFGLRYLQRGSELKQATTLNIGGVNYSIEISGYEVFNYASGHLYYPFHINNKLKMFGGINIGYAIDGSSLANLNFTDFNSSRSDEISLESKDFNLDTGLGFGIDYMFNDKVGIRASYYSGGNNVRKTLNDSLNFKNNSIELSAILNLKKLRKKQKKIVKKSKDKTKSRLLLPENSLIVQFDGRIGPSLAPQSKTTIGYGLKNSISLGVARSNHLNTIDFFIRSNYLNRFIQKSKIPINLVFHSVVSNQLDKDIIIDENDNLNFLHKLFIESKFRSNFLFRVSPIYVHKNIVKTKLEPKGYPWDMWFVEVGLDWFYKDNIQLYSNVHQQLKDLDISEGRKSSFKIGVQYHINTIGFDLSISNQYHLYGTAIANEIGLENYDNNIKAGFQINKIFN